MQENYQNAPQLFRLLKLQFFAKVNPKLDNMTFVICDKGKLPNQVVNLALKIFGEHYKSIKDWSKKL